MSLESNRTLGGVGALLIAIGSFIPFLSLVGIILVLVAMKGLADYYNEEDMFQNALYGFIFGIIGIVVFIVIFVAAIFAGAFTSIFTGFGSPSYTFPVVTVVALIVGLCVMFVFFLLQAIFYRKSFATLSEMSGERLFDTAGLLLLLGAILTIVLIGFILLFVAWILITAGFFAIKTQTTQLPAPAPPPTPAAPVAVKKKFCRYCGTENKIDAVFCQKCGKKLT